MGMLAKVLSEYLASTWTMPPSTLYRHHQHKLSAVLKDRLLKEFSLSP